MNNETYGDFPTLYTMEWSGEKRKNADFDLKSRKFLISAPYGYTVQNFNLWIKA